MSHLRNRRPPAAPAEASTEQPPVLASYNIVPIQDVVMHGQHPSLRFPEVRAAVAALLHDVADLPPPPFARAWDPRRADLFDWLGLTFGFQPHNVRNQREHLVLLLANAQLRAGGTQAIPRDHPPDVLHFSIARDIRKKLLKNYEGWCAYLGQRPHVHVPSAGRRNGTADDTRRELLYTALYLLIWGEAANLRFMPECLCYIFHYMALDFNHVIDRSVDIETGRPAIPAVCGDEGFLNRVVTPIYNVLAAEVKASQNGTKPHSAWRNYDDVNEYFWSRRVFKRLRWPLEPSRGFFVPPGKAGRIGKTGFVEQRSFWNLYRSFDRLWVMLILFFQAAMIIAWEGSRYPWHSLSHRDIQVRVLSVFITWAGLRFMQALLDAGTQYSLVSRETKLIAVRMVLKGFVAAGWTITFSVLYVRMWDQRWRDRRWSFAANTRVLNFLEAAAVFIIPQVLALVLFIIPWIRNFTEKTNWRILYVLTWWFQTRTFVGRGLREGLIDNIKYSIFWISLLAAKFSFSYFLQIKPMVAPTKTIFSLHNIKRNWFEFMPHTERLAVIILWVPVVLIYLMDIQIWYAVFSSLTGALIGLFSHLGEIRSVGQLRLRFQFFASAMQFNLMPEERLDRFHGGFRNKLYDAIHRLKLRYGFGRPYRKIEANEVEAKRFALIWNEIIQTFREEDIVSDNEVELLELPPVVWKIRVVRWPCLLLNNELLLALSQAKELVADDKTHWSRISSIEYRRCAVIEAYDSIRQLLLGIIEERRIEHIIVNQLFLAFDHAMEDGKFSEEYRLNLLPQIHSSVITLVELLLKANKDQTKIVNTLQTLYVLAVHDFPKNRKDIEQLKREGLAPSGPTESELLFEGAITCPREDDLGFYKQVRRLHTILTSKDSMNDIPKNPEARRRIAFFSNSLFMNMPRAPTVEKMVAFSVLTPYYNEDVLYNKDQLRRENEDGISILFYLQKIYEDDWRNFLERMRREGMVNDDEIWAGKFQELRLWASYRGQTLARTVRGMMYYYRALKMLAFLDTASEVDITEGTKQLAASGSVRHENDVYPMNNGFQQRPQRRLNRGSSTVSQLFKGKEEDGAALMKYTYVVACQIYGNQKKGKDPRAEDILALMKKNEALRVAYVDEVRHEMGDVQYYSVLVKFDQELQKEVEIYRIRLPGQLKLGEGKPENQNHAIIFTRGDAVQTIDMNQPPQISLSPRPDPHRISPDSCPPARGTLAAAAAYSAMYMAYGWPQSIPLDPGDSDGVVLLRVLGRLLLAVCPASLHLWSASHHKVRLARLDRSPESLAEHGPNVHAVWSPDGKTVTVLTSAFYLYVYKVQLSGKPLIVGGKQLPGLCLATLSQIIVEKFPLTDDISITSNFACDSKSMLLGLSNGHLQVVSWNAEFSDSFKLRCTACSPDKTTTVVDALVFDPPSSRGNSNARPAPCCTGDFAIVNIELSVKLRLLVALYSDCQVAVCTVGKKGLKQTGGIRVERWLNTGDAMCTSVASDQQILAVGCSRGVVELYDLAENARLMRTVSLFDWGYSVEDTGPVTCISWTPDNCAFAVGWKFRGLTVWSVSGCRLMCTIRQAGSNSALSPMVRPSAQKFEPLMGGTSHIQWDDYGYKLFAVEESLSERVLAFSFAKCCLNRGLSSTTYTRQILYGEDRILLVQPDDTDELKILHLNIPVSYSSQNWPVLHVVASDDGMYLAVAGSHGLVLYDLRNKRWRFFGDVTQEQKIQCKGLLWLGKIVIVCNYVESSNTYELLFFPRYHLDHSSLLYRKPLLGRPIVMDVFQDYILVTYSPFDVHIFHVMISGELSPASSPVLQLSTVRELSIMSPKSPPVSMRLIPEPTDEGVLKRDRNGSSDLSRQPSRCLILRVNGELSVLDMDDGHEQGLTNSVELFWVTCSQLKEKGNLIKEVSWLDYGHQGMQVWYPSHGANPFRQEDFLQLDPELEFDREVYPLGLLPNVGAVVGVSQRMSFSTSEFPCFEPSPKAQTILHCLLRHLLQRDKHEEALRLANLSAEKPHFSHCLEWLLFTVFEADISRPSASRNQLSQKSESPKKSLLEKTCDLLRNFSEYMDVVVSVARKTDGRHWADLFSAAGRSTEMFEECFQRRWYRTAACYILVIAKLEGPAVSQYCALRLLQATLDESLYELAGELVRFLLRSGRDYENANAESEKLSPRFMGYFLFRSPYKRQSSDLKSNSMKELSPHIASVMNILESHASYLMSGKELSKLVAFVKGTQFDLVEYLQRERLGSARLENFASALELIGEKLRMDTLQSRLDAEFLLAHMCSVKFKEWIVVLATLLRRAEVLLDLFRHDLRLWKAYSITLQSHDVFSEYLDLLSALEEELSSLSDLTLQNGPLS